MTVFRVSYQLALVFLVNELKTEVWVCIHDCPSMMVHSIPDGGVLIFKFNIHRMNGSILNTIDQVIAGDKGLLALEYLLTISQSGTSLATKHINQESHFPHEAYILMGKTNNKQETELSGTLQCDYSNKEK